MNTTNPFEGGSSHVGLPPMSKILDGEFGRVLRVLGENWVVEDSAPIISEAFSLAARRREADHRWLLSRPLCGGTLHVLKRSARCDQLAFTSPTVVGRTLALVFDHDPVLHRPAASCKVLELGKAAHSTPVATVVFDASAKRFVVAEGGRILTTLDRDAATEAFGEPFLTAVVAFHHAMVGRGMPEAATGPASTTKKEEAKAPLMYAYSTLAVRRAEAACHDCFADLLSSDASPRVRAAVARAGFRHDKLMHDSDCAVVAAVASTAREPLRSQAKARYLSMRDNRVVADTSSEIGAFLTLKRELELHNLAAYACKHRERYAVLPGVTIIPAHGDSRGEVRIGARDVALITSCTDSGLEGPTLTVASLAADDLRSVTLSLHRNGMDTPYLWLRLANGFVYCGGTGQPERTGSLRSVMQGCGHRQLRFAFMHLEMTTSIWQARTTTSTVTESLSQ